MPILRRKVNKAVVAYDRAKKADNTKTWMSDGDVGGMLDIKGMKERIKRQDALRKAVAARQKGLVGFARKKVAGKVAVQRVNRINAIRDLRARGVEVRGIETNRVTIGAKLDGVHKVLKGIKQGDLVETISLRGNIRKGNVVDAVGHLLFIKIEGATETSHLKLDRLKEVKKI